MFSGIHSSSKSDQARMSADGPSTRSSPDRTPCASSDLRSDNRAENDEPRLAVLGGDSRIQASWMLYSSLNRSTALMLIHINASSFSTIEPSDLSTPLQPDRARTSNDRMIEPSSSSLDPMRR